MKTNIHNASQLSVLDLTIETGFSLKQWIEAMTCLSAILYERDPATWREFDKARKNIENKLQHLEYEGDLSFEYKAKTALAILFKEFSESKGIISHALVRADQALGRAKLFSCFKLSNNESKTNYKKTKKS